MKHHAQVGTRIVAYLNDQFVVEAPFESAEEVKDIVVGGMVEAVGVFGQTVPVEVEVDVCLTWAGGGR